jgi:hypothetical protein
MNRVTADGWLKSTRAGVTSPMLAPWRWMADDNCYVLPELAVIVTEGTTDAFVGTTVKAVTPVT